MACRFRHVQGNSGIGVVLSSPMQTRITSGESIPSTPFPSCVHTVLSDASGTHIGYVVVVRPPIPDGGPQCGDAGLAAEVH